MSITYKVGNIIYKMYNDGFIDKSSKYIIKQIIFEKEDDWSLGYDISIKAYISKVGHVEEEEEYLLQYINHIYQMDKVYAVYA